MPAPYIQFTPLLEAMASGHLVLTPNHRSHVQLLDFYGQWRKNQGLPLICRTPEIFPVDIWIRRQWQQLPPSSGKQKYQILEPVLEASLWQDIISNSDFGANLVSKSSTARTVQEAWRLLHIWKISIEDIRKQNHFQKSANNIDDLAAFISWLDSFEKICQDRSLISLSPLVAEIITKITNDEISIAQNVFLTGFQSPPPLYSELIDVIEKKSQSLYHFELSAFSPEVIGQSCVNAEDEIAKAAAWAKTILVENPEAKIGIICQELKKHESSLQRIFQDIFCHDSLFAKPESGVPAFNISLQRPLTEIPVIETALEILNLNNTWIDTLSFCKLIRSPFILEPDEDETAISALEFSLRKKGELKVQLSQVRELLSREGKPEYSKKILSALLDLDSIRRQASSKANCSQWCEVFETQLEKLNWPGSRVPDHHEIGQLQSWSKALRLFKQTSHWHGLVSLETALSQLKKIISSHTVSLSNDAAQVQLITSTEADGLIFTHTWVMGLSEQQWPPALRPSPFIPLAFQKKAGMPESDIGLLTGLARQQLKQFRDNSSKQIVYSFPSQDDDLTLKPAAMLESFTGNLTNTELEVSGPVIHAIAQSMMSNNATELFRDSTTVPLAKEEAGSGGISLIANQADCPFKAFAVHRLGAAQFPAPVIGLPANVLGSLLHEVLENFWHKMQSQQQLLAASAQALEAVVSTSVDDAIQNKARQYPHTMTERFIAIESRRLSSLLYSWLEEEKKRGSFKILNSESRLEWKHAGLSLNMRIDRLDETADGSLVVVDYKSSKNSEIKWLDERQSDPQLMLYMLAVEEERQQNVEGLFIAQIHIEESRYKGISNNDAIYPKSLYTSKTSVSDELSWDELRQSWQESLGTLATEYLQGFVAVDPKNVNTSCTWCHLTTLCRINEEILT